MDYCTWVGVFWFLVQFQGRTGGSFLLHFLVYAGHCVVGFLYPFCTRRLLVGKLWSATIGFADERKRRKGSEKLE